MPSMRRSLEGVSAIVLTFWVGGMWVIGYIVAPILFSSLSDRQLAGQLAGKLFLLIGWIGLGCAIYLAFSHYLLGGRLVLKGRTFWLLVAMVALTAVGLFGLLPLLDQLKRQVLPLAVMDSPLRDRFAVWHGVSSLLYLLQSLIGAVLVVDARRRDRDSG